MAKKGKIIENHQIIEKERPARIKKYKQYFLIVCEDQKTEPLYFTQFKIKFPEATMFLIPIGTGKDPKGVVNQAIIERERFKNEFNKEIDFVWVVFDKDDADENETKINNFKTAFKIADKENISIAYSNEVFELWLLLHICKISSNIPLNRKEIYTLLQEKIRASGEKFKDYVYDHYSKNNILEVINEIGNETKAIEKASKLLEYHKNTEPIKANPSTKVHLLVKILREWIEFYNG